MVVLDEVEVCGYTSFHDIPPPYFVLATSKCSHSWRHRSKGGKGLVAPHQDVDLENIKERQDEDKNLMQSTVRHPTWNSCKTINDVEGVPCYTKPGDNADSWRTALLEDLILATIKWYHQVTGHPGSKRLYGQLRLRYYHRDLR